MHFCPICIQIFWLCQSPRTPVQSIKLLECSQPVLLLPQITKWLIHDVGDEWSIVLLSRTHSWEKARHRQLILLLVLSCRTRSRREKEAKVRHFDVSLRLLQLIQRKFELGSLLFVNLAILLALWQRICFLQLLEAAVISWQIPRRILIEAGFIEGEVWISFYELPYLLIPDVPGWVFLHITFFSHYIAEASSDRERIAHWLADDSTVQIFLSVLLTSSLLHYAKKSHGILVVLLALVLNQTTKLETVECFV